MVRLFSEKNKQNFQNILKQINWKKNFQVRQQSFCKELSITYNKAFLYVRLSRKRANDKPWITTTLKVSIKEKHKLYQKFIFSQEPVNAKLYKTFRNRLKTLIKKADINFIWGPLMIESTALKKCGNNLVTSLILKIQIKEKFSK